MEIIRRDTDYAIRALLHLALAGGGATSCGKVAKACSIPKSYAHKILKRMTSEGFLASRAGRAGGFRLNKVPGQISIGDVIRAIQGPVVVNKCASETDSCERSDNCPMAPEWGKLQDSIIGFLDRKTLQDVISTS